MDESIIMFDSSEAASIQTVTGWVSRHGRFWGNDERAARYDGCTHGKCETCDNIVLRNRIRCNFCQEKLDIESYYKMPEKEWDEKGMLYAEACDQYFNSLEEVKDYIDDIDTEEGDEKSALADMRLVICEPVYAKYLDDDYFADKMAEDSNLPSIIEEAMEEFNKKIGQALPLSWKPGKYRLKLESLERRI